MASRDELYAEAARTCGPALDRLARAYEADVEARRDLLQEIHIALWRSFENFDSRRDFESAPVVNRCVCCKNSPSFRECEARRNNS